MAQAYTPGNPHHDLHDHQSDPLYRFISMARATTTTPCEVNIQPYWDEWYWQQFQRLKQPEHIQIALCRAKCNSTSVSSCSGSFYATSSCTSSGLDTDDQLSPCNEAPFQSTGTSVAEQLQGIHPYFCSEETACVSDSSRQCIWSTIATGRPLTLCSAMCDGMVCRFSFFLVAAAASGRKPEARCMNGV